MSRQGCLLWILGLVFLGAVVAIIIFVNGDSEPPGPDNASTALSPSASTPAAAATPSPSVSATPPAIDCEDATTAFHASGGSTVAQRVCWEPTGRLRAEAGLPADIEPGSAPMRALCTALSDFVAGSGKGWKGFTVYSTHRLSPGKAMLTSSQPGQCGRP